MKNMMMYLALLWLIIQGVLGLDHVEYKLTQCDCRDRTFAADNLEGTSGGALITSQLAGNGFDCPEEAVLGFERIAGSVGTGVSGNIQAEFFNELGDRSDWYGVIVLEIASPPSSLEQFELIRLNIGGVDVVFDAQVLNNNVGIVSTFNGLDGPTATSTLDNNKVTFVFGELTTLVGLQQDARNNLFACAGTVCDQVLTNNVLTATFTTAVPISLLNGGEAITTDVRIEAFSLVENINDLQFSSGENLDVAVLLGAVNLVFPALPVFNAEALEVDEDSNAVQLDVNSVLEGSNTNVAVSFNFDNIAKGVANNEQAAGTFDYNPDDDEFGQDSFSFSYSPSDNNFPYECTLAVETAVIEIEPDTDVPVLRNAVAEVSAFAFVDVVFRVPIANSVDNPVDFPNGLLANGGIILDSLPDAAQGVLKDADCNNDLETGVAFAGMEDENFVFCFSGQAGITSGNTASFTYRALPSDLDVTKASAQGTFDVLGGNPADTQPLIGERSLSVVEDGQGTIAVGSMVFSPQEVDPNDIIFAVTINSLPDPSVGTLQFNGAAVTAGQTFTSGQELTFLSTQSFFNANEEGGLDNDDDRPINNEVCPDEQRINGVCPATFDYSVTFAQSGGNIQVDGVSGDQAVFGLIVTAIDNFGLSVDASNQAIVNVSDSDANNDGFIVGNVENLVFSSDNGADVFNVRVSVEAIGGVIIQVDAAAAADGPALEGFLDTARTQVGGACTTGDCLVLDLEGTPSEINSFFPIIEFLVPEQEQNGVAPQINLFLSTNADLDNPANFAAVAEPVQFQVVEGPGGIADFFQDPTNVALVVGGSGCCLFVVIVVLIVKATSVSAVNGHKATKKEPNTKIEFKARGKKKSNAIDTKRSFEEDDVEAAAPKKAGGKGEWEKHVDPETKEPFYHNPTTGETVWELPESI